MAGCRRRKAEPSYSTDGVFATADEARSRTQEVVHHFLAYDVACPEELRNVWTDYFFFQQKEVPPDFLPVRAMHVPTGIGKTRITIKKLAEWIPKVKVGPIVYAVPRHKLGQKIEQQFADHGIVAKVFRGRNADDPELPEKKMCHNLAAVELAQRCYADINETCCKYKKMKCRFFDRCGYQRQQIGDMPEVWIVAADMLFHTHKAFGEPCAVIIDEALWRKGLRGIEEDVDWSVAIDSLISKQDVDELDVNTDIGMRTCDRNWLGEVLMKQKEDGGVSRQLLVDKLHLGKNAVETHFIIRREWACMPKLMQYPGMSAAAIKKLARANVIDEIAHSRRIIKIWEEIRNLMHRPEIAVSGRLTLKQKGGQRVVDWKGVAEISTQFQVPTLLLDATLPERSILEAYHPLVEIAADIKVAMPPYVRIHQIIEAPTSATKLGNEKHIEEIRRYVLRRWIETGCKPTLVVCQMKVEAELHKRGLPDSITVAHYNDIAGIDDYKDVRLLILVGRTAPGPRAMEDIAAALSGAAPVEAAEVNGFAWYNSTKRGIRLPDGSGIATRGDLHPDPMAEAVRWLVHEGELIQALGRGRGVNRTLETPLDIDLLFDTALPITVDKVSAWKRPSLLVETAATLGVMPTAPTDMVKLWPGLWPNEKAAYRTIQQGVPTLPGFVSVTYQLKGRNMKPRIAYFNLTVVPDPHAWLETRLGPLAKAA